MLQGSGASTARAAGPDAQRHGNKRLKESGAGAGGGGGGAGMRNFNHPRLWLLPHGPGSTVAWGS